MKDPGLGSSEQQQRLSESLHKTLTRGKILTQQRLPKNKSLQFKIKDQPSTRSNEYKVVKQAGYTIEYDTQNMKFIAYKIYVRC